MLSVAQTILFTFVYFIYICSLKFGLYYYYFQTCQNYPLAISTILGNGTLLLLLLRILVKEIIRKGFSWVFCD